MTFYERIDEMNEEIRTEAKSILESYEAEKSTRFENMLKEVSKDMGTSNRRKNRRNRLVNIAKQTFPKK